MLTLDVKLAKNKNNNNSTVQIIIVIIFHNFGIFLETIDILNQNHGYSLY